MGCTVSFLSEASVTTNVKYIFHSATVIMHIKPKSTELMT